MAKFVEFTNAHTPRNSVLVNPEHVRIAAEVKGKNMVRLDMGGDSHQDVEGDFASVRAKLTRPDQ
jgi:hypothetical protein